MRERIVSPSAGRNGLRSGEGEPVSTTDRAKLNDPPTFHSFALATSTTVYRTSSSARTRQFTVSEDSASGALAPPKIGNAIHLPFDKSGCTFSLSRNVFSTLE